MPYPDGLETRQVSFGRAVVIESGATLGMRVSVKASRTLVHRPSGQPLLNIETVFVTDEASGNGTLELPVCDSPDMGLGNGTSIDVSDGKVTHTYSARIQYIDLATGAPIKGVERVVPQFAILSTDEGVLDLDDLIYPTGTPGSGIAIPDVWTPRVAAAEEAARNAERILTEHLSLPDAHPQYAPAAHIDADGTKHAAAQISAVGTEVGGGGVGLNIPGGTVQSVLDALALQTVQGFSTLGGTVQSAKDDATWAADTVDAHTTPGSTKHEASDISTEAATSGSVTLPAGNVQDLVQRLADLEARVAELEAAPPA